MSARILAGIKPADYYDRPGFSASLAKLLTAKSPAHAKAARYDAPTDSMDTGNVVHKLVLGAGKSFAVLPFDEYRTKEARAARDEARAGGLVPIKAKDFDEAQRAADHVKAALDARGILLDGESECVIEWTEDTPHGALLCRGMMDHYRAHDLQIIDLKITENAAPAALERSAENYGWAIQRAAYTRAVERLDPYNPGRVEFLFVACEPEAPFAVNVVRGSGAFRELGARRWERACATWARCQQANEWPGYGSGVGTITAPQWALAQWTFETGEEIGAE